MKRKSFKGGSGRVGFSLLWMVWLVFLFCQESTFAGIVGKIVGKVTDVETGAPLIGANILLIGTVQGAITDLNGDYFIINISPGVYTTKASMMGFVTTNKTDVSVSADRSVTVDFALKPTAIEGEAVTVVATREIVQMDVSASQVVASNEDIKGIPLVSSINDFLNVQVGIENNVIRGGGLDQTQFMMDGLLMVDNRANSPLMMVNISAVKELDIIKGGFNAEYGNVRSGLINIVTKEGDKNYHGSADFRISPAHLKHSGTSLFDPTNFYLRSFLDPAVCYIGTTKGTWDKATQERYLPFIGWNEVAKTRPGMTPDDCRNLFIWRSRAQGANAFMPANYKELTGRDSHEHAYGDKPDWVGDASFGGPVPLIGKSLGDLNFFASYRMNWEAFAYPTYRDGYQESNSQLKLTSRLSPSMKLTVEGLYGVIKSVSQWGTGAGINYYLKGGDEILNYGMGSTGDLRCYYWPANRNPIDVYRSMQGISFDHVLDTKTFYNIRLTRILQKNFCNGPGEWRDLTGIVKFGSTWADETPYGFTYNEGRLEIENDQDISGEGGELRDWSSIETINGKFDISRQIDKNNLVKTGIEINYDDMNSFYQAARLYIANSVTTTKWRKFPIRLGAYVQDKLEFEGMIANFGLRVDYNSSNTDWYTVDRYNVNFSKSEEVFNTLTPTEPAKNHLKISPRLGISHPISVNAKLYFNYGHFYSMPQSDAMYRVVYRPPATGGVSAIGNPSANLPKTVAYELGWEYNLGNKVLIHIAGYYKDVTDQTGWVNYTNYSGSVNYSTVENDNYADIRGFELKIDKRWGKWIVGWLDYNYVVSTSGYVGRKDYYQDPRLQRIQGLQNPYQEIPLARPSARANLIFSTPVDWGPTFVGIKPLADFRLSTLFYWKSGQYVTWDPLQTYTLNQNLHWKGQYNVDARISKRIRIKGVDLDFFADIYNVFNFKYLSTLGFYDSEDSKKYYESLHLPMYSGQKYKEAGYTAGNDKPGDVKSKDKPYINMPNMEFLTYMNLRSFFFGATISF